MHARFELEEFSVEMIQIPFFIIRFPDFAEWILWVVKRPAEISSRHEDSGDPDCANGIQPVGILQDFGFQRDGFDALRKTVYLNGILYLRSNIFRKPDLLQEIVRRFPALGLRLL
jgi:hypothetical protein